MTVATDQLTSQLSVLLDRVAEGEQVVITREGVPIAKLVGMEEPRQGADDVIDKMHRLSEQIAPGPPFLRELLAESRQHSYERHHGE